MFVMFSSQLFLGSVLDVGRPWGASSAVAVSTGRVLSGLLGDTAAARQVAAVGAALAAAGLLLLLAMLGTLVAAIAMPHMVNRASIGKRHARTRLLAAIRADAEGLVARGLPVEAQTLVGRVLALAGCVAACGEERTCG